MANAIRSFTVLSLIVATSVTVESGFLSAQSPVADSEQLIRIEGIVAAQRNNSIELKIGHRMRTIHIRPETEIVLKMNEPWFDWDNHRVIVSPRAVLPPMPTATRRPVKLPSTELFLFCRFNEPSHADFVMADPVKRLNNYLLSPKKFQEQLPTKDRLFLAGTLVTGATDEPVKLQVQDKQLPVILGFRNAVMGGFSETVLKPGRVHVLVTANIENGRLVAKQILFEPVDQAEKQVNAGL